MKITSKFRMLFVLVMSLVLIFSTIQVSYGDNPFDIDAKSAILVDAASGEVIYEKNPHEKLPPASITKIMLLLLAMEALQSGKITLEDEMIISGNAAGMGGSQIYLEEGEVQKVGDIMEAICLRSANDGAVALGEHIAGSEELFIQMMNNRAKELGMNNTQFKNITGLDEENHYTSAYDISLMAKELLKYPKIHQWLTIWMAEIKVGKEKDEVQVLVNTNRLVHDYQGANGIKTGYTTEARHCLTASATRGSLTLISVVLGCHSSKIRFSESKKMLDYGFANYNSISIVKKGDIINRLSVSKGKLDRIDIYAENNLSVLVEKGGPNQVEKEVLLPDFIEAPIKVNQKVGELIVKIDNQEVDRVNLIAAIEVKKATFTDMLKKILVNLLGN